MKSTLFLLVVAAVEARQLRPNYLMSQQRRYEVIPDKNFDVVEKHAMKFSDLEDGIVREPEATTEQKQLEREAALEQAELRASKGRYAVAADDTGQRFLDFPEGRGFAPGQERNLDESIYH